ncbi:MAG: MFS transporter, partial [Bacteroidota bacterium]
INKIQQIITEQTYQVIEKNKLNIRYNYQADILIFAMLGVLSLIFAFLLKREDRKKGYGLELPNIKE